MPHGTQYVSRNLDGLLQCLVHNKISYIDDTNTTLGGRLRSSINQTETNCPSVQPDKGFKAYALILRMVVVNYAGI